MLVLPFPQVFNTHSGVTAPLQLRIPHAGSSAGYSRTRAGHRGRASVCSVTPHVNTPDSVGSSSAPYDLGKQFWGASPWAQQRTLPSLARQQRSYQQNDGLVYLKGFFSPWVAQSIRDECVRLRPLLRKERVGTAVGREGTYVPLSSPIRAAFADPSVAERLSAIVGEPVYLSDYPVELRLYRAGSFMHWHRDEALFVKPQYELVFTVSNTSDSTTEWLDLHGVSRREATEPNSLLMVRAQAALHRVLPAKRGERSILKVVFTSTDERVAAYTANLTATYAEQ